MSNKIYRLGTVPNNMLVTAEELVTMAANSQFEALAICAVNKDGSITSALIAPTALFTLLGAVTDMQRSISDLIERR